MRPLGLTRQVGQQGADFVAAEAGDWRAVAQHLEGPQQSQRERQHGSSDEYGKSTVPTGLSNVTAISAGGSHSLALKSDGTVVAWGDNRFRQLDIPTGLSGVTAISAGLLHSLALKSDGTVVAWGDNRAGQIDVPAAAQSNVKAISAGNLHSLVLKNDGTIVAWGSNDAGEGIVPAELSNVKAIAAGAYHNVVMYLDTTAPTSSASTSPASPNANSWFNQDVTVNLNASDGAIGSGVKSITYSASGAQTIASTTVNGASASVTITGEGTTILSYSATDNTDNTETAKTLSINLDKTPPSISGPTPSRNPDNNDYYNHTVTFGSDCSDEVSSIDLSSVNPVPPYSGPDSNSASVTASCKDNAGNLGSNTFTFKYDATPPTITASAKQADGTAYSPDQPFQSALVRVGFWKKKSP